MSNDTAPWKRDWSEHGEINRGGQGVITEVRSIADPTKRAVLKRIVPRWQNDPQARERLQHEADLLTKLNELGVIVETLANKLAHEIRNLILKREQKIG